MPAPASAIFAVGSELFCWIKKFMIHRRSTKMAEIGSIGDFSVFSILVRFF
jgi:hypothetical protein